MCLCVPVKGQHCEHMLNYRSCMSLARVQLGSKAAFGTSEKKIQKPKNLRSDCRYSYVDTFLTKGHGLRALERERETEIYILSGHHFS